MHGAHYIEYSEQCLTLVKAEKMKAQLLCDTYPVGVETMTYVKRLVLSVQHK